MNIYVEKIIIKNRAPFDNLSLDFKENEIAVLTAVNGNGKTILLSYIADAWYEMAKSFFQNEFEGKQNKYYRFSSSAFNIDKNQPSFVYIRFKTYKYYIDYVDIREKCTQDQYNEAIQLEEKISFDKIQNYCVKHVSLNFNKDKAEKKYSKIMNGITYFPSYRYESPGYLNDPYEINLEFKKKAQFSGYLRNPIEVRTCLLQLANWVMDIVLDLKVTEAKQEAVY